MTFLKINDLAIFFSNQTKPNQGGWCSNGYLTTRNSYEVFDIEFDLHSRPIGILACVDGEIGPGLVEPVNRTTFIKQKPILDPFLMLQTRRKQQQKTD